MTLFSQTTVSLSGKSSCTAYVAFAQRVSTGSVARIDNALDGAEVAIVASIPKINAW
jgi:hypothetical protein